MVTRDNLEVNKSIDVAFPHLAEAGRLVSRDLGLWLNRRKYREADPLTMPPFPHSSDDIPKRLEGHVGRLHLCVCGIPSNWRS